MVAKYQYIHLTLKIKNNFLHKDKMFFFGKPILEKVNYHDLNFQIGPVL
jgi:hypothetical protein